MEDQRTPRQISEDLMRFKIENYSETEKIITEMATIILRKIKEEFGEK